MDSLLASSGVLFERSRCSSLSLETAKKIKNTNLDHQTALNIPIQTLSGIPEMYGNHATFSNHDRYFARS